MFFKPPASISRIRFRAAFLQAAGPGRRDDLAGDRARESASGRSPPGRGARRFSSCPAREVVIFIGTVEAASSIGDVRRVAPQLFQGIVIAGRPGKDMDDEEPVIHQDPFPVRLAFDPERPDAGTPSAPARSHRRWRRSAARNCPCMMMKKSVKVDASRRSRTRMSSPFLSCGGLDRGFDLGREGPLRQSFLGFFSSMRPSRCHAASSRRARAPKYNRPRPAGTKPRTLRPSGSAPDRPYDETSSAGIGRRNMRNRSNHESSRTRSPVRTGRRSGRQGPRQDVPGVAQPEAGPGHDDEEAFLEHAAPASSRSRSRERVRAQNKKHPGARIRRSHPAQSSGSE